MASLSSKLFCYKSRLDLVLSFVVGFILATLSWHFIDSLFAPVHVTESSVATPVSNQKLLCWVVTRPQTRERARRVYKTWGKRCDTVLFMSSQPDDELPVVALPLESESRPNLWKKAKLTFRYLYKNHLNDYDWFFKADDDTYALIDNLKEYLATQNPSLPLFFGHEFFYEPDNNYTFMSGGAGYVLSREAMRRLVEEALNHDLCPRRFKGEDDDVIITQCLKKANVLMPDTRDSMGNSRFLSCKIARNFLVKLGNSNCESTARDRNCLSPRPFTFHYVIDEEMEVYDYLLYTAKIAGDP